MPRRATLRRHKERKMRGKGDEFGTFSVEIKNYSFFLKKELDKP